MSKAILKTTAKQPEDIAKATIKQVDQIFPVIFGMAVTIDKVYRFTIETGGAACPAIEQEIEFLYRACREGTAEFAENQRIIDALWALQEEQVADSNSRYGTDDDFRYAAICHLVERAWGPLAIIQHQHLEDPSLKRAAIWNEGLTQDREGNIGDFLWGARATAYRVMLYGGGIPRGKYAASQFESRKMTPPSGEFVRKIFVDAVNGAKDWLRAELTRQNPPSVTRTKSPRRKRRGNPPIGPRTMVQYEVRFDAGPAIRTAGQRCFRPEHGRIEAQNTLVRGLRDNHWDGTGYYELYDVSAPGRPVLERKRLSPPTEDNPKWHWVDEAADPAPQRPSIRVTKTTLTPRQFALAAHVDGRPVGLAVFAIDKTPCAIRDRLLSRASHGHSVGAWHLATISTDPAFPGVAALLLNRALVESTGSGLASGPCADGRPVIAAGYDADEIFKSGAFQAMANVQEAGGYFVAFRRV